LDYTTQFYPNIQKLMQVYPNMQSSNANMWGEALLLATQHY